MDDALESTHDVRSATAGGQLPDGVDFVVSVPVPLVQAADTQKGDFRNHLTHVDLVFVCWFCSSF